ncbi:ABC transporter permease [Microbacterium sp. M3]|uniref:ABC transporter permease n=1 Tax=Microbacterium arthrosphaerae TaxID=792652 RepID=A0ABU4GW28_9MICO|nr:MULTISPECIES: ABC transporter permease [Microbacterium]MDW4571270.1 ABC transporter permease [Microbacterium arthrosphaerae]MDW7605125.1 ABC transporter permease [Microbacterium sp. M3]
MYMTYLRRELAGRKKQTIIVAAGLAIAIALVMIVNSLAAGVSAAQARALESVYGVGTDLTVTGPQAEPGQGGGARFDFEEDGGQTADDGTTELSQSRLMTDFMRGTIEASSLDTVTGVDGVASASGALSLTNSTFSGELPQRPAEGTEGDVMQAPPQQGEGGGFGGGSFDIDSFTVLGIDPSADAVGPLSAVELTDGRGLEASDDGEYVAVLDATYATTAELAVGDTLDVGGQDFEIVGIVASTSEEADTAANVYIPLGVAQELSGAGDVLSTIYVQADSSDAIATAQAGIQEELPDATVSSQSDLASTVSGSLSSASALITNLGTWLSVIVLAVALALAVLFTISGVSRRTREFGTLKAIGWSNGRVVGQVAGESVVQGVIGGVAGIVIGLAGIVTINLISPTISTAPSTEGMPGGGSLPGGGGGPFGAAMTSSSTDIVLQAPVTLWVIVVAVGIAVLGGLVAGAFGGWRAARLSPAEALRSVG